MPEPKFYKIIIGEKAFERILFLVANDPDGYSEKVWEFLFAVKQANKLSNQAVEEFNKLDDISKKLEDFNGKQ